MASVRVATETELARAWEFLVELSTPAHPTSSLRVRLSFADYEYWSHGVAAPCRVVELLVNYLAHRRSPILARDAFDAARARRECPGIDAYLLEHL